LKHRFVIFIKTAGKRKKKMRMIRMLWFA